MEEFVFALNATVPLFLVILLGWYLNRIGLFTKEFCLVADRYVFRAALPISLFKSVATMDLYQDFSPGFFLFCAVSTTVMFLGVWALSGRLMRDKTMVGAFSQASVRSSAAVLGLALAQNIYGSAGMVPMAIVVAVPLFNIYSVIILSFSPRADGLQEAAGTDRGTAVRNSVRNILHNPLILGIVAAIPFALLKLRIPTVFMNAVSSVGGTATPIALLVIGASFSGGEALAKLRPALAASAIKLFVLPAVFLPLAALLGFRDSSMVAILIMAGSPTTVACYTMARQMHGDSVLTSNTVVLTTLLSSVSLTLWIYLLRLFALI